MGINLDNLITEMIPASLRPDERLDFPGEYSTIRRAGVLVPLLKKNNEWELLFTRRTDTVNDHKGQVSFPGGMAEPGDSGITMTAIREAREEIGLQADHIRILGYLSEMHTVTDFLITPVVGLVTWPFDLNISQDEVARVFTIPLKWLMNPHNWEERSLTIGDRCIDNVLFFREYDGEVLWGVTARITLNFLETIGLIESKSSGY
jgi:8-oxo-dGTP pyrophosphatase MutT (NUDIX family)